MTTNSRAVGNAIDVAGLVIDVADELCDRIRAVAAKPLADELADQRRL